MDVEKKNNPCRLEKARDLQRAVGRGQCGPNGGKGDAKARQHRHTRRVVSLDLRMLNGVTCTLEPGCTCEACELDLGQLQRSTIKHTYCAAVHSHVSIERVLVALADRSGGLNDFLSAVFQRWPHRVFAVHPGSVDILSWVIEEHVGCTCLGWTWGNSGPNVRPCRCGAWDSE